MELNYEMLLLLRIYHETEIKNEDVSFRSLSVKYHYETKHLNQAINRCCQLGMIDQLMNIRNNNTQRKTDRIFLQINEENKEFVGSVYHYAKNQRKLNSGKASEDKLSDNKSKMIEPKPDESNKGIFNF